MIDDGDVRILHGDALEQLATLPSESVHCIVTSPPFWALRDYGHDGQIGLEATPEEWCVRLVDVFRECRRVLRSDGVMWLEVGDTYAANRSYQVADTKAQAHHFGMHPARNERPGRAMVPDGLKPKDLVGAPWMLAFALRADGWYLRSDTIWARPNPMPESVTDRPTKAHSYVFLLSKSARYFYDADAIREEYQRDGRKVTTVRGTDASEQHRDGERWPNAVGANARSVWSIATEPTPFAHFATFPQALVERCIKAGTSEYGCCSECGAPWVRVVERTPMEVTPSPKRDGWQASGDEHARTQVGGTMTKPATSTTTGWTPTCDCSYVQPVIPGERTHRIPCTVLDPFMGSGTTALVARRLGRHAIGIELNAEYIAIAAKRLQQLSLLQGATR